jgi:NTP pyrophosphatase (non-canonical NTP hydrolase)
VDNAYSEATHCPICPMLATDRDDALREVEHLRSSLWAEIVAERERAHRKHGDTSMESCHPMADRRLRVLTEEVGEVARVLNDREHDIAKGSNLAEARALLHLREELIQVAAMAVAWIAALDGEALS